MNPTPEEFAQARKEEQEDVEREKREQEEEERRRRRTKSPKTADKPTEKKPKEADKPAKKEEKKEEKKRKGAVKEAPPAAKKPTVGENFDSDYSYESWYSYLESEESEQEAAEVDPQEEDDGCAVDFF